MPRINYLKNNFTSGQASPLLGARSDTKRQQNAVKTLKNMTILEQGGITSRPGSIYSHELKDSGVKSRLITFEFSTTQSYIIELGAGYFRFMKEDGLILESDLNISGITSANPGVVSSTSHGLADGDQVYITDVLGMTEVNDPNLYYTVANKTTHTFELQDRDGTNVDTSGFTAYASVGTINRIYTIDNPYSESDLFDIQITQSADVLTLTHPDFAPRELTRTSDTSWTLTPLMKDDFDTGATLVYLDGPYLNINATDTTLTLGGTTGSVSVTASAVTGINDDTGFQATDIGRLIRWKDAAGNWTWLEITARSSTTVVTATIKGADASATTATTSWRLGSWSRTTGFPRAVTYHQQRIVYGGTSSQPDALFGSNIDDFPNFAPSEPDGTVADDHSWTFILASGGVNAIYWIASHGRLRVGTEAGCWSLWGGSDNFSITPTNVDADLENNIRCKSIQPINLGSVSLFAQRSGKVIRELAFSFEQDSLVHPDLTVLAEDILGDPGDTTDEGVIQMAYQLEPTSVLWSVVDNGSLIGLNYSRDNDIVGWHKHIFGGTDVVVESVATLPGTGQDITYLSVKRTINGSTRRFVEKLDTYFRGKTSNDARFSDCSFEDLGQSMTDTVTPGATTGDGVTFTAGSGVFVATDVGRIIENQSTGETGRAVITAYTNGTEVTADIDVDFTDTNAIAAGDWVLSRSTITGLDALEGETVAVLANGGTLEQKTVSSGSITLGDQYTNVKVGLPYTQEVELLDVDFGDPAGSLIGQRSKVIETYLELFESSGGFIGYDSSSLSEIIFREGDDITDQGVGLFTGQKRPRPKGGWRDSLKLLIRQTDPLPMTLLAIIIKGLISED